MTNTATINETLAGRIEEAMNRHPSMVEYGELLGLVDEAGKLNHAALKALMAEINIFARSSESKANRLIILRNRITGRLDTYNRTTF